MDRRDFLTLSILFPLSAKQLFAEGEFIPKVNMQDIFTTQEEYQYLLLTRNKLAKVQKTVGYGKFNLISFDETLNIAKNSPKIGEFTNGEIAFLEKIFYDNPNKYGFYGIKTTQNITDSINKSDTIKINGTGHYLFRGKSYENYNRILKDVGRDIVLTSGIRSIPKQMSLYLDKIYTSKGNISEASRVIAPPAYTHHAISDFDVGKKGFGNKNFSTYFTTTEEFKNLIKLNYVSIRYTENNKDGVIYEPWHIQVV